MKEMSFVIAASKCILEVTWRIFFYSNVSSLWFSLVDVDREDICDMILDRNAVAAFERAVIQQVCI